MCKVFQKLSLQTLSILLLLFYVASFSIRTDFSFNQDLGRHIKLGEIILQTGEVPKTNLFSYTFPNFLFVNHHYFFEILVYLGQQTIGIQGLIILKVLIILLTVGLILSISKSPYFLTLPLGFIFMHVFRERVEARPEIFSFLFTALTYFSLERFQQDKKKFVFALPIIQLLWVNTHIYFPVGLILQGIYLIHFLFQKNFSQFRTLLIILIISTIASLLNPNGLNGFLYPLTIFGNYGYTIAENQNLFLLESIGFSDPNFFFVKISAILITLSIIFALIYQKLQLKNFLLCLFGLGLATVHVRSFPYLIFISLPAILANLNFIKLKKQLAISTFFIFTFLLLLESYFYISGEYYLYNDKSTKFELRAGAQAKNALDFVLDNNLPQPIFNNFDIGSYIIYRGFPNYKVFVDGRPEAYPKEFFQQIYIPVQEDPQKFKQLNKEIGFKTIIFSHTDQTPWGKNFLKSITSNPEWQTVYLDDFIIVLVKKEITDNKQLKAVNLVNLSPESYQFQNHFQPLRLSLFLINTQNLQPSELFAKETLKVFPDSPIGNLIMANLLQQQSNILNLSTIQTHYQKSKNNIWW